jgi:dephospho-CoA kinase
MIYKVGLTGGLASGKTTVAERLAEYGIPVLDADKVVHDLYRPGRPGANAVAMVFGVQMIDPQGGVDRKKLAARVFSDQPSLKTLNGLIHPLVITEQAKWFDSLAKSGQPIGVVEATLLIETGGRSRYDFIATVSAPEMVRLSRALGRIPGEDSAGLAKRIAAQLPDSAREAVADLVILNDGTRDELIAKADALAEKLIAAAAAQKKP